MKTDKKVIITVALTGGFLTKKDHPQLPEQPDEIAEEAYRCYNEGASIVHIHARKKDGSMSDDPEIYNQIHKLIWNKCDLILQDTTGGGPEMTSEERVRSLQANPEMATLNMGSVTFKVGNNQHLHFLNPFNLIDDFAQEMHKRNVKPEIVVFNHSCLKEVKMLIDAGLIQKPYFCSIPLSEEVQGALPKDREIFISLIRLLPDESVFSAIVPDWDKVEFMALSILMGGHVRIGFEDSMYLANGKLASSNADLVSRTAQLIKSLGYEPATPQEARQILNLEKR